MCDFLMKRHMSNVINEIQNVVSITRHEIWRECELSWCIYKKSIHYSNIKKELEKQYWIYIVTSFQPYIESKLNNDIFFHIMRFIGQ